MGELGCAGLGWGIGKINSVCIIYIIFVACLRMCCGSLR